LIKFSSGYQAAILSLLTKSVVTVERVEPLALRAAGLLEKSGYENVEVYAYDGNLGKSDRGEFDAIVVTACAAQLPLELFAQLREGGRMVIPIGQGENQVLYRYQKVAGEARIERSVDCRFVPMLDGVTRGSANA
jgi:protein-L-isoaspartate(D-aspartate) O-methyltransferase